MKNSAIQFALFVIFWFIFQLSFIAGQYYQWGENQLRFKASIEKRVALDLPKLKVANQPLKTAADPFAIKSYINHLNAELKNIDSPLLLRGLQNITVNELINPLVLKSNLVTSDQSIELEMQLVTSPWLSHISFAAPLLALLFMLVFNSSRKKKTLLDSEIHADSPAQHMPKLQIDLRNKSIKFGHSNNPIILSNKPFCFYAALVDYCAQTEAPNLKHNYDVPDELLQIANKYFYRLIELGHTKRKRPDFGANLDKTLSEIRSALDETFKNNIDDKEQFYPPKAQGEGSRSKMHNFAILNKDPNRVEFIGK